MNSKINWLSIICSSMYNKVVLELRKNKPIVIKWVFYWMIICIINKFVNPEVEVYIGKNKLKMLFSSKIPFYQARFDTYDNALPRICESIINIDKKLLLIDIGANIGDTVSLISEKINNSSFLCIEGDQNYLNLLEFNSSMIKNNKIFIEPYFCVDNQANNLFNIKEKNGTAFLVSSENNNLNNIDTLDNIVNRNDIFKYTNILKIDTDGFELTVLGGGRVY